MREKLLMKEIYKSVVGIEIEDTQEYCDAVAKILDANEVSYTRGSENSKIKEIRFHLAFNKMLEIIPSLLVDFTVKHAQGASDSRAGSMHVHVDTGTLFISTKQEIKNQRDTETFLKYYYIVEEIKQYMKRNDMFRIAAQSGSMGGFAWHDALLGRLHNDYCLISTDSKGMPITYNGSNSGKRETLEIRINEVFPLWYPMFMLMVAGYRKAQAIQIMNRYDNKCVCYKYCNKVFSQSENMDNSSWMKKNVVVKKCAE